MIVADFKSRKSEQNDVALSAFKTTSAKLLLQVFKSRLASESFGGVGDALELEARAKTAKMERPG